MNKFIVSAQALKRFLISCIEKEPFKEFVTIRLNNNRLSINGYSITMSIENDREFSFDLNVYQITTLIKLLSLIEEQPVMFTNSGQSSITLNNITI